MSVKYDNGLISVRQGSRGLLLELFAANVFLMTGVVISSSGKDCVISFLLGSILVLLLTFFYWNLVKNAKFSFHEMLAYKQVGVGKCLALLYVTRFVIKAGFLLTFFYELLQKFLLQDTTFGFLVAPFFVLCVYGAGKKREHKFRSMELLFWFAFIPMILAILFVIKDVNLNNFKFAATSSLYGTLSLKSICYVLALYSSVEWLIFFVPSIRKERRSRKVVIKPVALSLLCNGVLLTLSIGILGLETAEQMHLPALRVLQSGKVPGGFLERYDILLIAFWIFGVYCNICSSVFYSGECLRAVYPFPKKKCKWEVILTVGLICLCSLFWKWLDENLMLYIRYCLYIDIPVGMLSALLVVTRIGNKKSKRIGAKMKYWLSAIGIICICGCSLTGCSKAVDVENWNYVLTLGVDATDCGGLYKYSFGIAKEEESEVISIAARTMDEAIRQYGQTHDQSLQIGHLGSVIFGSSLMEREDALREVQLQLRDSSQIPITTSVYGVSTSAEYAMNECPEKNKTLGEYLNDLVGNNKKYSEQKVMIKNLYAAKEYPIYVYYLKNEKIVTWHMKCISGLQNKAVS